MKMKIKKLLLLAAMAVVALNSCENGNLEDNLLAVELEELNDSDLSSSNSSDEDANKVELANALLRISRDNRLVGDLHDHVMQSLEYGLDEIAFVDEIMNPNKYTTQFKSASKLSTHLNELLQSSKASPLRSTDGIFTIEGLEIYWPYSEDWDGVSQPVVTLLPSNYEDDRGAAGGNEDHAVVAYKFSTVKDGISGIDTLLVNEEYAMNNPVWVVRNQSVKKDDLINLKRNNDFNKITPRNENLISKKQTVARSTTPYKIAETTVASIKSEKQHDDWLNGGSEYYIYWFFPVKDFGLSTHKSMEIHFSRKEIKNKTTKNITFMANYDWDKGQSHNKLKVLEYDPGSDIKINVKFFSKIKIGEAEIGREFSTDIKINRGDDDIMDHTIPRTAMFTNQTRITDNHYRKYFSGDGVTVGVNIKGINGLEF